MDTHHRAPSKTVARASAALGLIALVGACAHVSQEDLDQRISSLRDDVSREIRDGDRRVEGRLGDRIDGVEDRLAALNRDLQMLEEDFGVTVERLETALRFNTPVHFGFDEAEVGGEGKAVLKRFSQVAAEYYPEALITVEGFTDPAGSAEYNRRLGLRRAEAVKSLLMGDGRLAEERIRTVSYGESAPRAVAEGEHGPGRQGWQNRRVVLVIDHGGGSVAAPPVADESGS